jgi:polar amino acid transport system substrate-binding protein
MTLIRHLFAIVLLIANSAAIHAQQSSDPRVADLVQAGKLRVAIGLGSPVLAMKNPNNGDVRGPALDLAQALAKTIGTPLEAIEYQRPGAILADAQKDKWDLTFLVVDPARAEQADFSIPYMQSDFTYLVPAGSSKQSVAELDQAGVRIAVPRGDASDLRLTKTLKQAELLRMDSIGAAIELVHAGKADAYAAPRVVLLGLSSKAPGSRVLKDGFANISWAVMAPKGKADHIAYVNDFLKEAKTLDLIQQSIDHYGLKGIQVAGSKNSGAR